MNFATPLILRAIDRAAVMHEGQVRKLEGIPFISHPMAVFAILAQYTENENILAAGLLHDTLEDTPYTEAQLRSEFGDEVAEIVLALTEDQQLKSELGSQASWEQRKTLYLQHLQAAAPEALLVAAADKLHNLLTLLASYEKEGYGTFRKFNAAPQQQVWFYSQALALIHARLGRRCSISHELGRAVRRLNEIVPQLA